MDASDSLREGPLHEEQLLELNRNLRALARDLVADAAAADDLVQETWVALLEGQGRGVRNLGRWMRAVLRHGASRGRRRELLRRDRELRVARADAVPASELAEWRSSAHLLIDAVAELDDPFAEVLRLRYFEELPVKEVAERLGVPANTVKTWTRRGLERLRARLDRDAGGDGRAWALALGPLFAPAEEELALLPTGLLGWGVAAVVGLVLTVGAIAWALSAGPSSEDPVEEVAAVQPTVRGAAAKPAVSENSDDRDPAFAANARTELSPAPAPEAPVASTTDSLRPLEVVVVDHLGAPVAGATVVALLQNTEVLARALTDENGEAALEVDASRLVPVAGFASADDPVEVTAFAAGHALSDSHYIPLPLEGAGPVSIPLRGPERVLRGRFVDEFGDPVAGASILAIRRERTDKVRKDGVLVRAGYRETRSDEAGRFELDLLDEDTLGALAWAPQFVPTELPIPSAGATQEEPVFELERGAAVSGQITNTDGSPALGARITLIPLPNEPDKSWTIEADQDGFFALRGVPDHLCVLLAQSAQDPGLRARSFCNGEWIEEMQWDAVLEQLDPVRARVVDPVGEPVEGCTVFLGVRISGLAWTKHARTDEKGEVRFEEIPDTSFELWAYGPDEARMGSSKVGLMGIEASQEIHVLRLEEERTPAPARISLVPRLSPQVDPRGVRLHAWAEGSGWTIGPWNPERERIEVVGLRPADYLLHLLVPGQGAVPLGERRLAAGQELDLGPVSQPATVSVRVLPWEDSGLEALEIATALDVGRLVHFVPVALFQPSEGARLELVPGDYVLRGDHLDTAAKLPFTVEGDSPLELDPRELERD